MCECRERVNTALKEEGQELDGGFRLVREDLGDGLFSNQLVGPLVFVATVRINPKSRKKMIGVIARCCPWCGEVYPWEEKRSPP